MLNQKEPLMKLTRHALQIASDGTVSHFKVCFTNLAVFHPPLAEQGIDSYLESCGLAPFEIAAIRAALMMPDALDALAMRAGASCTAGDIDSQLPSVRDKTAPGDSGSKDVLRVFRLAVWPSAAAAALATSKAHGGFSARQSAKEKAAAVAEPAAGGPPTGGGQQ